MFGPAIVGLALFLLTVAAALPAQDAADPTTLAVRLSFVDGQVQVSQGNQILADQALANTPLFEGTKITTSDDGKAELQFDDGSVVRISPNSSLVLGTLRKQGGMEDAELQLESGLGYFELQGDTATSHIRAQFGDSYVTTSGFTVLRISLDNLPGEVAVFSGNAHLERTNALSLDLHGGESVALNGSDPGRYNLAETIEPDSWDAWNSDRDQALTSQEASRTAATTNSSTLNSNNPAWSDLDANGNWYNVPGQGYVWSPYSASSAGWDPYGCGSWMWTPRFGYIWVSCETWGYMPYSSGFWNYFDGFGWGWYPGYGSPWWNGGGWGTNIGSSPARYQPPHRPRGGPIRPHEGGSPIRGGGLYQPHPVVAYNRLPDRPTASPVMHTRGGPVTISGTSVQPLRPIVSRPTYDHEHSIPGGGVTRTITSYPGAVTYPGSVAGPRQGYSTWINTGGGRTNTPAAGGYSPRPTGPSAGTYNGGGWVSHPSGGGSSHVAGSSGNVGGSRSSGGGASMGSSGGGGGRSSGGGGGGGASMGGGGGGGHSGGGGGGSSGGGGGGGSHH